MANLFLTPGKIIAGRDALASSRDFLAELGTKALVVTDTTMIQLGNTDKLLTLLDQIHIQYTIYSGINSEPCDSMIAEGVRIYQEEGCDCLIAIGGGSPIDSMKAIAAAAANGGHINDYLGRTIAGDLPPMCAVPTTAGTGSEATQFTIINNTEQNIKMLLKGAVLIPDMAIIDPVFTLTAPPAVTAATGLDALCHAIEAYTSVKAFPMADTMAKSAIQRIFNSLYECYSNGSNEDARADMAVAALEAGIAFNNSSVTIIHGMSRPIGALFHVPHGLSNAMLLDKCLHFAAEGAMDRFFELGLATGAATSNMTTEEGAMAFIQAVSELCGRLNIDTPEQFGIAREDFFQAIDKMSQDALDSGSPANTRRKPTLTDIKAIYQSLYE